MTKILIIINPSSGDETGLKLADSLETIYKSKEIETKRYETTGEDNFKKLIQDSMKEGYEKIVVSGGDGTISELVNGIADFEKRPKILLIPSGTTNNFGRTIGSEKTREEFLKAIEEDDLMEIKVDLGRINGQYFISSIAVGILPSVGWETDTELKATIGPFAYFLEGIKAITKEEQDTFDLKLKVDQEETMMEDLILFIVGLSNSIIGIETFFEGATINDGQLHYFGLKQASLLKEASALMKQVLQNTEKQKDELIFTGSFNQAELVSESTVNFLIDGDKGPTFPIKLGILPKHLTFVVPKTGD